SRFAQLDRYDPWSRIGTEKQLVIFKRHGRNDGTASLSFRAAVDGEEPHEFRARVTNQESPLRFSANWDDKWGRLIRDESLLSCVRTAESPAGIGRTEFFRWRDPGRTAL